MVFHKFMSQLECILFLTRKLHTYKQLPSFYLNSRSSDDAYSLQFIKLHFVMRNSLELFFTKTICFFLVFSSESIFVVELEIIYRVVERRTIAVRLILKVTSHLNRTHFSWKTICHKANTGFKIYFVQIKLPKFLHNANFSLQLNYEEFIKQVF